MTEPATIESPPEPWVSVSASMTPDGALLELVRLADVVRWLMTAKRLQFLPAVHAMHKALAGLEGLGLYVADGLGGARAVGAADVFGLTRPLRRRTYYAGIGMHAAPTVQPQLLPDSVLPGQSAALYFVRNVWGNGRNAEAIMDSENVQAVEAARLAMPCEQAAALWGCTSVVVAIKPKAAMSAPAVKKTVNSWTPETKAQLLVDFNTTLGRTVKERMAALADKWNTGEANIKKYLGEAKKDAAKAKEEAEKAKKNYSWPGLGSR